MAKLTLVKDICKRQASPQCTGTFTYERKKGRPPVSCAACRSIKVSVVRTARPSVVASSRPTEGKCGCGNNFQIQARGRISNRCDDCRTNGTVWREDSDGMIQMIQAAQIAREEQERKDALGDERARNLVDRMRPLLEKKHRTVIVH